jgi:hypothetical protein
MLNFELHMVIEKSETETGKEEKKNKKRMKTIKKTKKNEKI